MSDKLPKEENGFWELLKKFGAPVGATLGTIKLLNDFYTMWLGNQTSVTFITAGLMLVIIIVALLWIIFSKRTFATEKDGAFTFPRYSRLAQQISQVSLGVILISLVWGGYSLRQRRQAELADFQFQATQQAQASQTLPPATATATRSVSDDIHYAIILDASESMNATFDGQNKWSIALQTADSIIDGSNANAHYALFAAGGSGPNQSPDPCLNPSRSDVPFGSRDAVRNYLTQLQPKGGGSFKDAFNLAKAELQNLPREAIGTIVFITSTEDSCKGENVWREDLKYAIQDLDTIKIRGEIVLLDDNGARTQEIAEFMNNLSENVNVQAPQNIQILNNITINNIVVNINNFIQIEATARAPESHNPPPPPTIITETFTPDLHPPSNPASPNSTSTSTPTPSETATATLTSTSTPTRTVTPSPTLWPGIVNIISPGNGASFGCPDNQDCIIPVIVQWIPDTQAAAQGLYLSIWVKPYPGDTNYLFYSQSSPTYLGNGLWQSTPVYLGGTTDLAGTPFEIYAIVTNQFYPTGMQTSPLPNNSGESVISVAR